jgi:signal transduction histidine kinase
VTADSQQHALAPGLLLPARTSHVQITFNALTLSDPMRVRFRYRLDGFDRDWVESGASRQATYTNLPPRQYRFRVSATGGDGTWSEPGVLLEFGVAPMFYQTRWFYALGVLAVAALVYAAWRMHVRQVRRQFAMVLGERIRMSRAIHDTLLQGLAALALQVDDLSHHLDAPSPDSQNRVLKIRRQVEEYIRQARRSIWDLRSPILDARPLPQALRETTEIAIAGRSVAFDVTVSGSPRAHTPKVDEQLLLIGQEAVNNAIQHGRASRVALALEYQDDAVRLEVRDDGCGFDPGQPAPGHYGLISMRERAEQVRGRLTVASAPGCGTLVETVVPTS